MDRFCIVRGTLLDNNSVRTLEGPELHSQHCLLDPGVCVRSGYTVLGDPDLLGGLYSVAAQFDPNGDDIIYNFAARSGARGACRDCTGELDSARRGFRASVVGVVEPVGDPTSDDPLARAPSIKVTDVRRSSEGCSNFSCPERPPPPTDLPPPTTSPTSPPATVNVTVSTTVSSGPKDIVIDWFIPGRQGLPSVSAAVGDTLVFQWDRFHNVFITPSQNCDDLATGSFLGDSSPVLYTIKGEDEGTMVFACGVPGHCLAGHMLSVNVTQTEHTASTSDPSCEDANDDCEFWASDGECEGNPDYMLENCAMACDACVERASSAPTRKSTERPTKKPTESPREGPTTKPTMLRGQSERAAADPNTPCEDANDDCESWASNGECEENPDYMLENCARACDVCVTGAPAPAPAPQVPNLDDR